jgi:hypothetical protein
LILVVVVALTPGAEGAALAPRIRSAAEAVVATVAVAAASAPLTAFEDGLRGWRTELTGFLTSR